MSLRCRPYLLSAAVAVMVATAGTAIGQVVQSDCATPGNDGSPAVLGGIVNTYYPATAAAAAGARCISVGAPRGAVNAIAAGDLLLVVQMQDASINSSQSNDYGDGAGGLNQVGVSGYRTAGVYEYVAALGAVGAPGGVGCSAGQLAVRARSGSGGLLNAYRNVARSGDIGRGTFQVVRVPQYRNATLSADITAAYWNGGSGGIVALDVTGTLNINARTISASGRGFRGGGGRALGGAGGLADTDRRTLASAAANGAKGEGIAGTPRFTFDQATFDAGNRNAGTVNDNTDEGYNNGSQARGGPGNAGGGGTDGNPGSNDENSGGGGGANGGGGGVGGNAWNSQDVGGGFGGAAFGSGNNGFALSIARIVAGGGGGAGTRNNSTAVQSSGGAGGGLILLQSGIFLGNGIVESNGASGPAPDNDGAGGGGAGGTIVLRDNDTSPLTTLAGFTLRANGGVGANSWITEPPAGNPGARHGPGGGGGGGLVWRRTANAPGLVSVTGGVAGASTTANDAYNAQPGGVGAATTFTVRTTGIFPGFECATVPVTLAHFEARSAGAGISLNFTTATETRNVGFRVYAGSIESRRAAHPQLLPSRAMNAAEPSRYQFQLDGIGAGERLWLADVDIGGRETLHGPFDIGRSYGRAPDTQVIDWQALRSEHARASAMARGNGAAAAGAKLWIGERGLYRVTHADLAAAGIALDGVPVAELAVSALGEPVQRMVSGPALFGAGSAIEFFAEPSPSLYSDDTPFLLERNAAQVREVAIDTRRAGAARAAWSMHQVRYAPQRQYSFAAPGADPWYADRLLAFAGTPAAVDVALAVDAAAQLPQVAARLQVALIGGTDWPGAANDHEVDLSLDGAAVARLGADGLVEFGLDTLLRAAVTDGTRTLRIEATGATGFDFDVVNVDAATLSYPRLPQAQAGRWSAPALQLAPVPANAVAGQLPPPSAAADALFSSGFESAPASSGMASFAVRNLPHAEAVAWRRNGRVWSIVDDVRVVAGAAGFDAYVALDADAAPAAWAIASRSALARPRIEALEPVLDIVSGPARYLVIAPAAFHASLAPLLAARQAQGLSTAVVDVAQIYRQFGDSVPQAEAIARYLRVAAARRGTQYVLLAGGDTYDYNDYLGLGSISFVPTLYAAINEVVRFAPADALFGDLNDDGVPELAIGRLPARSSAELDSAIGKILAYAGGAERSALLVAGGVDASTSFQSISDELALALPGTWSVERAYVDVLGAAAARTTLLAAFDRGPALVSFIGHSAPSQWTFDPIFSAADARALGNAGKPSVVLQFGCWSSYFVAPAANTLGHSLLLAGDRGAAAAFGATALTTVASHQALSAALLPRLVSGALLGDAVVAAKRELAIGQPARRDVIIGTALLGDPAMPLR